MPVEYKRQAPHNLGDAAAGRKHLGGGKTAWRSPQSLISLAPADDGGWDIGNRGR